ncbi:MAG: hypothetical protein RIS86_1567 [Planctomycetota bacterium]|jgi:prepilin-type N-terminal cleavage/methylation domain-containing protein
MTSGPPVDRTGVGTRARAHRGLSLVEVLVAASILVIAGLAALELLASADGVSAAGRRTALAATEAEQALADAARRLAAGGSAARRETLASGSAGSSLDGCTIEVRATGERLPLTGPSGETVAMPVERLVAEVRDPAGRTIVALERLAPVPAAEGTR